MKPDISSFDWHSWQRVGASSFDNLSTTTTSSTSSSTTMASSDSSCYSVVFEDSSETPTTQDLRTSLEKPNDDVKFDTLRKIIVATINGNSQVRSAPFLSFIHL